MNYLDNRYAIFEEAYRDAYYRKGLEMFIMGNADVALINDYQKSILSDSFDPISFMEEKHISETAFSREVRDRFLSETNTCFIYCFLLDASETICSFVIQKAFETLPGNVFFTDQELSSSNLFNMALCLPSPFRNAFFKSCIHNSAISESLLTCLDIGNKDSFINVVVNEIGAELFARPYPFLCLAAEFAKGSDAQSVIVPSLDKYIICGGEKLYTRWSSSLYAYIVYDIDMGDVGVKIIPRTSQEVPIVQVEPKSHPTKKRAANAAEIDRIHYSTLYVNREKLFDKLINDNWVAQPDGPSDGIELIDKLKYFFQDNNDKPSHVHQVESHPIRIKWCKHTITLNYLIRLLYNSVRNVKKKEIIDNLGKYGEIDKHLIADLDVGSEGCWNAVCNVFEKKNARKSTIDTKTKNTEKQIEQIKEIVTLYFECRK